MCITVTCGVSKWVGRWCPLVLPGSPVEYSCSIRGRKGSGRRRDVTLQREGERSRRDSTSGRRPPVLDVSLLSASLFFCFCLSISFSFSSSFSFSFSSCFCFSSSFLRSSSLTRSSSSFSLFSLSLSFASASPAAPPANYSPSNTFSDSVITSSCRQRWRLMLVGVVEEEENEVLKMKW